MRRAEPSVTVVVPTFNRRTMLEETLRSVQSQSDVRVELIVVDDASTDGTAEWLEAQPAIRSIRLTHNQERVVARNRGLAEATGEFVLFLDDDDLLADGALAVLSSVARRTAAAAVVGSARTFGAVREDQRPFVPRVECWADWRDVLFGWIPGTPGQVLFRRRILDGFGGFPGDHPGVDDFDLCLRFSLRHPMRVVRSRTLHYRVHPGQQKPARSGETDAVLRAQFAASLDGREGRTAERILRARPHFLRALDLYAAGGYRVSLVDFARAARAYPAVLRSPLLGPWVGGLMAKACLASVLPRRLSAALQGAVRRRRG